MVGEFIGTTMFLFFAFAGTQIANLNNANPTPSTSQESTTSTVNTSNLMFIALAFGFSLMVNVWVFFRISGGLFNPAISLALALVKIISPLRCVLLVVAQILGGISAAALINALLPGSLYVRTRLGGDINTSQGTSQNAFDFRAIFGDVHDCRTCICRIYARSRET
jgi:aquaporin related protein